MMPIHNDSLTRWSNASVGDAKRRSRTWLLASDATWRGRTSSEISHS